MLNKDNCKIKWIVMLQIYINMENLTNHGHFIKNFGRILMKNTYSETCINWTLNKQETCLNQISSEVHSYQFQCILILCKPNTCINQTNSSVRKEFGLDRLHCNWTNYNIEKRGCTQCHAKDTPFISNLNKIIKQKLKSNRNENIRKPSTHQVKAVYQIWNYSAQ